MLKKMFAFAAVVLLFSCGQSDSKEKSEKGKWSQKDRTEYLRDCISSAKKSFEERGMQADSTIVTTLCKCSGEMIEERYAYNESSKIQKEEIMSIMQEAAEKCLKK